MTGNDTTIPTEITDASDAELAAWAKALNAGTMSCPIDFGQAIFAEIKRRHAVANRPDVKDLYALHQFCGVGYEIIVGMEQDADDTFWIWYAGQTKPLEGFGPYGKEAEAIADAANLVLGDLAAETGLVAKVRGKQRSFGAAWEEVMRLGGEVAENTTLGTADEETVWGYAHQILENEGRLR